MTLPPTVYDPVGVAAARVGANTVAEFVNPDALDALAAMGGTYARAGPTWAVVEDYATGALALPAGYTAAFEQCGELGIEPILVAAYSPPHVVLGSLELVEAIDIGETVWSVTGDLAAIDVPYCHVQHEDPTGTEYIAGQHSGKVAIYGVLIRAVDVAGGTITLAAAPIEAIASGANLTVRRLKYPAVPTRQVSDPSVGAFLRYTDHLVDELLEAGIPGWVEITNEPPWLTDQWANRSGFYDVPPPELTDNRGAQTLINAAQVHYAGRLPANGVQLLNGAANKWGGYGMAANADLGDPSPAMPVDAIHMYADTGPERGSWDPREPAGVDGYPLLDPAEYELTAEQAEDVAKMPGWERWRLLAAATDAWSGGDGDPRMLATEIGSYTADETKKARHITRRVGSLWGLGIPSVVFNLADSMGPPYNTGFAIADEVTYAPRQAFLALQRLLAQVSELGGPGGSPADVPTFVDADDLLEDFPPMVVGIYGAEGALLLSWRMTRRTAGLWVDLAPNAGVVPMEFQAPPGSAIASSTNIVTGAAVPATLTSAGVLEFEITESMTAVRLELGVTAEGRRLYREARGDGASGQLRRFERTVAGVTGSFAYGRSCRTFAVHLEERAGLIETRDPEVAAGIAATGAFEEIA